MKLYLIHAVGSCMYKIGYSEKPEQRVKKLQLSSPLPLVLVHTVEVPDSYTGRQAETWVHWKLKQFRSHGEWFQLPSPNSAIELLETENKDIYGN